VTRTKLSDDFSDDCWQLSDKAFRLHIEGLLWSNRKLTDLRLHKSEIRRWAKHPEAASELVEIGWWSEWGDHYLIIHHGTYQRSREAVIKQQEANKRNGKKGGRPSREQAATLKPVETDSVSESKTQRDGTGQAGTREQAGESGSVLPMAAGAEWPTWRGDGPNPFDEYK
jgi:hypothetical protein